MPRGAKQVWGGDHGEYAGAGAHLAKVGARLKDAKGPLQLVFKANALKRQRPHHLVVAPAREHAQHALHPSWLSHPIVVNGNRAVLAGCDGDRVALGAPHAALANLGEGAALAEGRVRRGDEVVRERVEDEVEAAALKLAGEPDGESARVARGEAGDTRRPSRTAMVSDGERW